jgi:hypothetical protein
MPEEVQMPLPGTEPEQALQPEMTEAGMPGGGMADPDMGGGDELDLEAILSEIDEQGPPAEAPAPAAAPTGQASEERFADALESARGRALEREEFQSMDMTSQRVSQLEQQLQQIQNRNMALEQEQNRQGIHNTISEGIKRELIDLGVDIESKTAKGISRLITNSVLVSVAQTQANSGNPHVDPESINQTVRSYTKVVKAVAKEMANRQADSARRVSSSGAQPAPYKLNKGVGEMSEKEFSDVVLANLRGMK